MDGEVCKMFSLFKEILIRKLVSVYLIWESSLGSYWSHYPFLKVEDI